MSPARILQNRQSSATDETVTGPELLGRGLLADRALDLGKLAAGVGIEVLQLAGLDARLGDEVVDFVLLETDHTPELVGGKLPLVDEPVQRSHGHAEPARCLASAHPANVDSCHGVIINTPP